MNTENLRHFFTAARSCAMSMMEGAAFIQQELPNVKISDAQRLRVIEVCATLIETKHDVIGEMFELNREADSSDSEMIAKTAHMILRWLGEGLHEIRTLADELQIAANENPAAMPAFFLVAQTFVNISTLFDRAHDEAPALDEGKGAT
jgi:hypothetical protein